MGQGYEVFSILEVIQRERDNKRLEQYRTTDGRFALRAFPVCFAGIDLDYANELQSAGGDYDQAFTSILYKDRGIQGCPKWVQYRPNLSPQWHLEDFKMLDLERKRREFELKLEEINRRERKRTDRIMIGLAIAAILFAAMQVYAALASINPEHWLFNWLR